MNDIDVFLDLEAIGVGHLPFGDGARANVLLDRLPGFLEGIDYVIRNLWGTACLRRPRGNLPGYVQVAVRNILLKHGGTMFWSREIADEALKREIRKRLAGNSISQTVLLVADDHGFTRTVVQLRESNRTVIVAGHHVSRQLVDSANRVIPLSDILGEDKEYAPISPPSPFNGIELPELP